MTWLIAYCIGQLLLPIVLYVGYGFVMAAKRAEKEGLSSPLVIKVDLVLAILATLLDGAYNAFWLPILCLDFRLNYAFKMITYKGVTFPFFEVATERLSRYNEQLDAWVWHKFVARHVKPFLDGKDPKGWHIRKALND